MYNSAACTMELLDALSEIAHYMPINAVTAMLLARMTDGLADLAAILAHELEFRLRVRPPLRLVVTTQHPRRSRRGRTRLRIIYTEGRERR